MPEANPRGGRRTPAPATYDNQVPAGRLAAAETVITPLVVDPVAVPRERSKRGAVTTVIVLMVIVAIVGGVALAIMGAMLA
jgi:hypothetical protein